MVNNLECGITFNVTSPDTENLDLESCFSDFDLSNAEYF